MVQASKITLDKEYWIKCSILTTETYEKLTGKKFGDILKKFARMEKKLSEMSEETLTDYLIGEYLDIQKDVIQLAYCMILEAKKDGYNQGFSSSLEEFMGNIGGVQSETIKGVLAAAKGLFPGKI